MEGRLLREKTVNTPEHPNVLALQRQVVRPPAVLLLRSLPLETTSLPLGTVISTATSAFDPTMAT